MSTSPTFTTPGAAIDWMIAKSGRSLSVPYGNQVHCERTPSGEVTLRYCCGHWNSFARFPKALRWFLNAKEITGHESRDAEDLPEAVEETIGAVATEIANALRSLRLEGDFFLADKPFRDFARAMIAARK